DRAYRPLLDAPIVVQEVAEVQDVHANLEAVPLPAEIAEAVLRDRQVDVPEHRHHDAIASCVFSAMLAQVRVLLDVRLERSRLLLSGEGAPTGGERREVHFRRVPGEIS